MPRKCVHEGCTTIPSYNTPGEKQALYCKSHASDDMINVLDRRCVHEGCTTQPSYNTPGEKQALYCKSHASDDMINVLNKRCIIHLCDTNISNKYRGYCLRCFIYTFPGEKVARNYKTKEFCVAEHIKQQFQEYDWICDKTVSGGCSRKRPDMLLHMGSHVIIVEIDENQHDTYETSCDNFRTMSLYTDLGYSPIVFIRFNPDRYINNGVVHTSCWRANVSGIMVVKKSSEYDWKQRLSALCETITKYTKCEPEKAITTISLFYNKLE
jgi:hypothetical protein